MIQISKANKDTLDGLPSNTRQRMSQRTLTWWQWFLIGSACIVLAIIMRPIADRHGYATSPGFVFSILAVIGWSVCWVIAIIRLGKWVWSLRKPMRKTSGGEAESA